MRDCFDFNLFQFQRYFQGDNLILVVVYSKYSSIFLRLNNKHACTFKTGINLQRIFQISFLLLGGRVGRSSRKVWTAHKAFGFFTAAVFRIGLCVCICVHTQYISTYVCVCVCKHNVRVLE